MANTHRVVPHPTRRRSRTLLGAGAAALVMTGAAVTGASPAAAQADPFSLGSAESFALLAGTVVVNTGPTTATGDVGVSPGSAVVGYPPGVVVPPGTIHAADPVAAQAQVDAHASYQAVAALPATQLLPPDLGGLTLSPGVYQFVSGAQLQGVLTLDAQGDPNATFILRTPTYLVTATNSAVVLVNGASACGVYWHAGSSATFGTGSSMVGTVAAQTSVTVTTGASVSGRLLAMYGAVTTDTNDVTIPTCTDPVTPGGGGGTPAPPAPTPGPSSRCTIMGTSGDDHLRGTPGRDVICAGAGRDVVNGRGGNDLIYGNLGGDVLRGGPGNDVLVGARGRDRLVGGTGADVLRGGPRGDRLNGLDHVRHNDAVFGGPGNDSCRADRRDARNSC
jgi:Ca2+-binding RTX toxin-like protein